MFYIGDENFHIYRQLLMLERANGHPTPDLMGTRWVGIHTLNSYQTKSTIKCQAMYIKSIIVPSCCPPLMLSSSFVCFAFLCLKLCRHNLVRNNIVGHGITICK